MVVAVMGGMLTFAGGCVSLDKYKQAEFANKKLAGEKAGAEQELYDARNNAETLRNSLAAAEDKLRSKDQLAAQLQAENDRLSAAVASAQKLLEEMAKSDMPQTPIVIEGHRLPAELDTALKSFADAYPESVVYDARRGIVKWTADLLFALGSDVVKDSARESLKAFAGIMQSAAAANFDVLIVGHTDNLQPGAETRKRFATNWELSAHRAISVSNVLQGQGVGPTRIGVMGFGEYRPIDTNSTEDGRSRNRRVEIYVVPAGSIGGVVAQQQQPAAASPIAQPMSQDDGIK
jgi:chemotaxis protein MotB